MFQFSTLLYIHNPFSVFNYAYDTHRWKGRAYQMLSVLGGKAPRNQRIGLFLQLN